MGRRILNRKELRADHDAAEKRKVDDEHEEEKPKKKKKVAKPKAVKEPKKTRSRTAKVVRQRVVWGVFSNSNQCVATYEYPRKAEAVQHAARLMQDKKSTHFVQPVKEPWEDREKKEKDK